ncbi:hypothetical protein AXG93_838s1040 [Marchantia polymorpha subsp. ruderalis]|uniref:Uncharacterized protein n=1 Tax=Marchantia polymorpha subsp. ruderalis TaxID=1480154 RepID=A0A176WSB8_MARPO|nr:hypothetical protein AXG93_838s1040 [Marchantia polymorpha subsp. ruderalis]
MSRLTPTPTKHPPARPRVEDERRATWAPRKRKWDAEPDQSQREVPTAPVRRRPNHEPASRSKQKARKLVLPTSSADTGRAAVTRDSPSSEEDVSAEVLGRSADLPAPKSRVPSEDERRTSGYRGRHAATADMPAMEKCLPSEQVPFDDLPSGQEPSAQEQCREEPSAQRTSGRGVEVAAEEAARLSSRESPRISAATEILETEDNTASEEEEAESVRGTPTGVLCEQVVPLLRCLDRKAPKYADPRHRGSYVELVRNWTRIKVATNPELIALDQKYRQLEER